MADQVLTVSRRDATGKNESRRLRREGQIPAILYGEKKEPVPISVLAADLQKVLSGEKGLNAVFDLVLAATDQQRPVMVKEFQVDPITDHLIHADFIRIVADQEVTIEVPVELVGTAVGVKTEGGQLEFSTRSIEVRCLPRDIPAALRADISHLGLDDVLHVRDLVLPPGVVAVTDPGTSLASIHHARVEAEPVPEGQVPAEGAEVPETPEPPKKGTED